MLKINKIYLFGFLFGLVSYLLIQALIFLIFHIKDPCYGCLFSSLLINFSCLIFGIGFNCILISAFFYGLIGVLISYLIFKFKNG